MLRARADLALDGLKTCSDQYTNYSSRFAALDAKSLGTATVAGLLLGGAFGFVQHDLFAKVVRVYGIGATYPMRALLLFALGAIVLAVYALEVRGSPAPYRGDETSRRVLDILRLSDSELTDELLTKHYALQLQQWRETLPAFGDVLNRKGKIVRFAQAAVVLAGICVAIFVWLALGTFS